MGVSEHHRSDSELYPWCGSLSKRCARMEMGFSIGQYSAPLLELAVGLTRIPSGKCEISIQCALGLIGEARSGSLQAHMAKQLISRTEA